MFVCRKVWLLLAAVTAVNLMSLLDAISTLLLVDNDCCFELNPLINSLMEYHYLAYFGVKLLATLLGTIVCWHFYERRVSAQRALKVISRTYCVLLIWHGLLLTGIIR
ncbi:MAG: DUF5658 family protein [Acidobacteriota bacterium]